MEKENKFAMIMLRNMIWWAFMFLSFILVYRGEPTHEELVEITNKLVPVILIVIVTRCFSDILYELFDYYFTHHNSTGCAHIDIKASQYMDGAVTNIVCRKCGKVIKYGLSAEEAKEYLLENQEFIDKCIKLSQETEENVKCSKCPISKGCSKNCEERWFEFFISGGKH